MNVKHKETDGLIVFIPCRKETVDVSPTGTPYRLNVRFPGSITVTGAVPVLFNDNCHEENVNLM